ncbi:cyclic nucleotide-binding domain-containing protein [Paenibacillus sp. S3N08]|uniref:Cyclic nucleotide-binding domain-containing protein n=1 Tax=Paenibacillus agricola TaxID=2716264 RepID=A0ABX0JE10_9BACL|nr:cyclic nucleotide-binding domain-containing protein [Paenibacillus agricola]NHN34760.1 cyclic nucleotide-binding domain-containing protein [Paenibacillus agricola]
MSRERAIHSLNLVPLFNLFDSEEKGLLAAHARERSFRMGESIVDENNQGEAFYIVIAGQARKIGISNDEEKNLGLLHPGEHFGEYVLFGGESLSSVIHVRASTDLQVLELSGPNFRKVIGQHPQLEKQLKAYISSDVIRAFLKNSTVFTHADHSAIRSLLTCLEVCEYSSSEYLVREGEKGESFYILESGSATVERGTDVVNRLYPGDFFGELALLTGGLRKASVRAVEPVRAYRLDKVDFDRLIAEFPVILESIRRISDHYGAEAMNIPLMRGLEAGDVGNEVSAAAELLLPSLEKRRARMGLGFWRRLRRSPRPALLQQSEMDCGPTCLTMIARHYGMNAGVNRMRERCNVGTEGTSMLMLVKTAESLGFQAQGIKATPAILRELSGPLILHWEGNHYIVVYEIRDDELVIVDPAIGYVETVPLPYVLEHWTGFVVTLKPTELLIELDDKERFWSRYIDYFRPYHKLFGSSLALAILLELGLLAFPIATQQIFDRVLETEGISLLNQLFIGLLLFVLVIAGGTAVRQLLVGRLAYRIDNVMLNGFYKHLFLLPYTYFVKRTSGDIITRVFENEKIRKLLTDHGFLFLLDGVSIVVYGILMFYYEAQLALITLAVIPLYMLLYGNLLRLMRRNVRKLSSHKGSLTRRLWRLSVLSRRLRLLLPNSV